MAHLPRRDDHEQAKKLTACAQALARGVNTAPPDQAAFGRLGIKGKHQALFATFTQVATPRVYPENLAAWSLFCGLQTQWQVVAGAGGAHYTGLPYPAVESALRLQRVPRSHWADLFADVRVLELAWLSEKAKLAKARADSRGRS